MVCGMNELAAMMALPRTRERIYGELLAADAHYTAIKHVAGEFAALDFQPIVFIQGELQPRELHLPQAIREALHDAALAVAKLRYELADSVQRTADR
jgi:hypothetical protein